MKDEASYNVFRERAIRYLAQEMNSDERYRFEEELSEDAEKQRLFREFSSIWESVDRLADQGRYDLDAEWNLLSGKIDLDTDINPPDEKAGGNTERTLSRRVFAWRIAAVLVAGLAGVAGWLVFRDNISYEQLAVEHGPEVVELADGSTVTLNAGSTFKYAVDASAEVRKVVLKGEAFFEVARDSLHPFIIEAGSAVVEVLGTSFNVSAYDGNRIVEVTVSTGLVSMAAKNRMSNQIILNPGNSGVYDRTARKLELFTKANPNATAWKTRELIFSETPLSEVVKVISHVYQADVHLEDASLSNCPITVSFHDQELDAVLSVIVSTLDLRVDRKGGAIVLSGEGCD